jgi:hypothetical protein
VVSREHNFINIHSADNPQSNLIQDKVDPTPPNHAGLSGSRMVVRRDFHGQYRDILSFYTQEMRLIGRYDDSVKPYYPDYDNACKNCCGPAAGQSILEWHNVPVKDENGHVLTKPKEIQGRLADQMNTRHKAWGTRFLNFSTTLVRPEYIQDNNICIGIYGTNSIENILYQLTTGTPMVFEIWNGKMLHYVTVYGHHAGKFVLANSSKTYTFEEFWEASIWKGMKRSLRFALMLVGEVPGCSFSYCPTGCTEKWDYLVPARLDYFTGNVPWYERYFDDFNSLYSFSDENNKPINLAGVSPVLQIPYAIYPFIKVGSGGSRIKLAQGNKHVINYPYSLTGNIIENNSTGRSINARVFIDTFFFNNMILEPSVYWYYLDKDGEKITSKAAKINATIGVNYEFVPGESYEKDFHQLVFSYHRGFRKITWDLYPCTSDYDDDGICDEFDEDMDNDGVLNDLDNCPRKENPLQEDYDGNGIGYACDCEERCNEQLCYDPSLGWVFCPPCDWMCRFDIKLHERQQFLEHLIELYNWKYLDKIVLNPLDPNDVIKGKFAYWILNNKVDRIFKGFNSITYTESMKTDLVRYLVSPDY